MHAEASRLRRNIPTEFRWIFEFEEVRAIPKEEDFGEAVNQWEPVEIKPKALFTNMDR